MTTNPEVEVTFRIPERTRDSFGRIVFYNVKMYKLVMNLSQSLKSLIKVKKSQVHLFMTISMMGIMAIPIYKQLLAILETLEPQE